VNVTTLRNLFYVLTGTVLAIFIIFNFDQRVVVYFTRSWHTREIPLSLALFGALILGFLVAALLAFADQLRLRARLRQMRRSIERLETQLGERRKPLIDDSAPAPPSPEPVEEAETGPETL
jgi:uncharacterized integral membrane protein